MDSVRKVSERLKLTSEETAKLRTTSKIAGATSETQVEAVLAGLRRGAANVAPAREALSTTVEYPSRIDECPVCFAHMEPITLAGRRSAFFCPVHNVVMPSIE